ncbi:MAG: hypothetical protein ACE5EK_04295 [Nitrospinales bacterium]
MMITRGGYSQLPLRRGVVSKLALCGRVEARRKSSNRNQILLPIVSKPAPRGVVELGGFEPPAS